jgi:hypothetical protein
VSPMDGANNPAHLRKTKPARKAGFLRMAGRLSRIEPNVDSARPVPRPLGHRLRRCPLRHPCLRGDKFACSKFGQRAALAPERGARSAEGESHGWGEQS